MARLDVLNLQGKKTGSLDLDDRVFDVDVKEHVLWEVVRSQLASRRAGTHSTLRRSEVRGGGRKPYKQKGTGRARQGSIRSPNFVGGGSVFGPKPRDYSYSVPKKVRALALCGFFTDRIRDKRLVVVESLKLEEAKTSKALQVLSHLGLSSVAIVNHEEDSNISLSVRNLPKVKHLSLESINLYDLLNYETVLSTPEALKMLELRLVDMRQMAS